MLTDSRAAEAKSRKSIAHETKLQSSPNLENDRYPKHVWSPAGGWYSQPSNWKFNTAIMGAGIIGITAMMWNLSAQREYRDKFPEEGRFFPSR
jgi:hypothetical protein